MRIINNIHEARSSFLGRIGVTKMTGAAGNAENKIIENNPGVVVDSITFNDGTTLSLDPNSIVVFTGANNCGKSQILRDIENSFDDSMRKMSIVVNELSYHLIGEISHSFLLKSFHVNEQGRLEHNGSGGVVFEESLLREWENRHLPRDLHSSFIKRISTEMRLSVSNSLSRDGYGAAAHPIYKMMKSEELAEIVSAYFYQAFGMDLVVNRNMLQTVPLYVGKAPNKARYTMNDQDEYNALIDALPQLQEQGDGMRSFASILLDTFTSEYSLTLIDEPEAFLHPPQARIMGKMLGMNNPSNRQLIVSTHSEDFLQGILDSSNNNVTIVRVNRQGNTNRMSVLENAEIEKLWTNPLLRYSNILSGLFHEMVVVCESDYDCLFYQAIMNAVYESNGEIAPDVLFTHCGGKSRARDVVSALKAVDVPVVAICDFDLIDSRQDFQPLIEAFRKDWESIRSLGMKVVYDNINAKKSAGVDVHALMKSTGKTCLDGDAPAAFEKVDAMCRETGLFIVPCGEMECFDKTINKKKKDWVFHVLENYDLGTEPKLAEARSFVCSILSSDLADK